MTHSRKIIVGIVVVVAVALATAAIWAALVPRAPLDASPGPQGTSVPPTPSVFPTPTPGTTTTVEPSGPPTEKRIGEKAVVAGGVQVEIVSITSFDSKSTQPGDLSGPAVSVVVRVGNATESALDLSGSSVTLTHGIDNLPAPPLGDPISNGLPARADAGATVEGTYEFTLARADRSDVTITLDLLKGMSYVVFRGTAPTK